jgi:hypothetical protein
MMEWLSNETLRFAQASGLSLGTIALAAVIVYASRSGRDRWYQAQIAEARRRAAADVTD